MKKRKDSPCTPFSHAFYGTATVGERGQLVIPAEARTAMGMQAGDKVLIMKHPAYKGLMLFKLEAMREFLDDFASSLQELDERTKEVGG